MATAPGPNGEPIESISRLWVIVDDLKFELPHPKEKDGRERLAARVLKHCQREREKDKETERASAANEAV